MLTGRLFDRMLRKDKDEVEAIKHAKALEAEKAMYSVRNTQWVWSRCVAVVLMIVGRPMLSPYHVTEGVCV